MNEAVRNYELVARDEHMLTDGKHFDLSIHLFEVYSRMYIGLKHPGIMSKFSIKHHFYVRTVIL